MPTAAALELYIDHTAGHLMELAARHLGAEGAALPVVREFARGAGTAALLRALPELRARGRDPLPRRGGGGRRWRGTGWRRWRGRGRRRDRVPSAAAPALLAGWQAGRVLRGRRRSGAALGRAGWRWRRSGRGRGCSGARSAGGGRLKRRCRRS